MDDILYIKKRLEEIYSQLVDEVKIIITEHEKTFTLTIILRGVSYFNKEYEIDKKIDSVGYVINYINNDIRKVRR